MCRRNESAQLDGDHDDHDHDDTPTGQIGGIRLEPRPEIVCKVLRIRVKCHRGQVRDQFRYA